MRGRRCQPGDLQSDCRPRVPTGCCYTSDTDWQGTCVTHTTRNRDVRQLIERERWAATLSLPGHGRAVLETSLSKPWPPGASPLLHQIRTTPGNAGSRVVAIVAARGPRGSNVSKDPPRRQCGREKAIRVL
jgi:hypothetical protein